MQPHDAPEFLALLNDVWTLKGTALLTDGQKALFFSALSQYSLNEVKAGLMAHIRDPKRGQFLPMPADVIAQISGIVADDGRPGAEEAWAMSFRAVDEAATVVWTHEMSEAFGICRHILNAGDEVGARMAFKEAYNRLLAAAREQRNPALWSASLGHDLAARDAALLPHIAAGRVDASELQAPAIGLDAMLSLPAPEGASAENLAAREKAQERLRELRDEFASRATTTSSTADAERARTNALKADAASKVSSYAAATNVAAALPVNESQVTRTSIGI